MPAPIIRAAVRRIHAPPFHLNAQTQRIVIAGNNAMLFAAADILKHFGRHNFPTIDFFYTGFWMDRVRLDHDHYGNLNWGQTPYGLPKMVRERLFKINPDFPEDKYVPWSLFQSVRQHAMQELQAYKDVNFHFGKPEKIAQNKDGTYSIFCNNNETLAPANSWFYWWFREPRPVNKSCIPHTELYTMQKHELPEIVIVVGRGLSLVWLLDHMPSHMRIINIASPESQITQLPVNSHINIEQAARTERLKVYTTDRYRLIPNDAGTIGNILDLENGRMVFPQGFPIYVAAGLQPDHRTCAQIPADKILLIPHIGLRGELIAPRDPKTLSLFEDKFIAARDVATGSLPHAYSVLMYLTNNIDWTADPSKYLNHPMAELLKTSAQSSGIDLRLEFFDRIDARIGSLDHPLNFEKALQIYIDEFKKIQPGNDILIRQFIECLYTIFKDSNELSNMSKLVNRGG
jgi:hypothetical protein